MSEILKTTCESDAIDQVWEYFDERSKGSSRKNDLGTITYNYDLRSQSASTAITVNDFAFDRFDLDAYRVVSDIANTYGLIAASTNPNDLRTRNARTALRHYNNPKLYPELYNQRDREHYTAIARDFVIIDSFIEAEHKEYKDENTVEKFKDELSQSHPSYPVIDLYKLAKLVSDDETKFPGCDGVNIESILIKSSATFNALREQFESESPDLNILSKLIYSVESFYAPVCEIIGYDALSMALRDYTKRVRVLLSEPITIYEDGKKMQLTGAQRIKRAESMLDRFGDSGQVEEVVTSAIDQLFGTSVSMSSIENQSGHNIKFGVGTVEFADDNHVTRYVKFRWRVKSVGSLADKFDKYASPLDLIGITLITGEEPIEGQIEQDKQEHAVSEVAELFDHLIECSSKNFRFSPTPTPDRAHAFVAEGSKAYIDVMKSASGDHNIHDEERSNGFQVAKGTMLYMHTNNIYPVEVQIQTLYDRKVARIGRASHPIYKTVGRKANVPPELLEALLHISDRKHSVNAGPTKQSLARAVEYLESVDRIPPPHIGSHAAIAAGVKIH